MPGAKFARVTHPPCSAAVFQAIPSLQRALAAQSTSGACPASACASYHHRCVQPLTLPSVPRAWLSMIALHISLQGFPDYFALVGVVGEASLRKMRFRSWVRHTSLTARFQQVRT